MTTGHGPDSLGRAWTLEPQDLARGFLRLPFDAPEGTRHLYEDATTYVLARVVERVTGRPLDALLDERVLHPMGIDHAEWDRLGSGAVFGFHGLHLTTEAVAASGELLLRGGRWGGRQLVGQEWVARVTSAQVGSASYREDGTTDAPDFRCGYGYQVWRTRHGYLGNGAFGQLCVVVPELDLVVAMTAEGEAQAQLDALWEGLLPGVGPVPTGAAPASPAGACTEPGGAATSTAGPADDELAARLAALSLPCVTGTADLRSATAVLDPSAPGSALPDGGRVTVDPAGGGWHVRLAGIDVPVGHGVWHDSAPLGRPVAASGAWQGGTFVADLRVVATPHRVRLTVDAAAGAATATWSAVPLTGPDLRLHLRSPLTTRPDVG